MKISKESNLIKKLTNDVIVTTGPRIELFYPSLQDYRFVNDHIFEDDHFTQLIHELLHRYLLLRMQTYAKRYNLQVIMEDTPSIRHHLN